MQRELLCATALATLVIAPLAAQAEPANGETAAEYGGVRVTPNGAGVTQRWLGAMLPDGVNIINAAGVDPTGARDSTVGINAVLATTTYGSLRCTVLSAGTYHITNSITLGSTAQPGCLHGHYGLTTIDVGSDFNPAAAGVLVLRGRSGTNGLGGPGPLVEGITFNFHQGPNLALRSNVLPLGTCTTTGSLGCQYPWAIYANGVGRERILGNHIEGAWNGIYTNGFNGTITLGGQWLQNNEIGALNVGLRSVANVDFSHINANHFWPMGLLTPGQLAVYGDGNTTAADFGRNDQADISDLDTYQGKVILEPPWTWGTFTGLHLDAGAVLNISGGGLAPTAFIGGYQSGKPLSPGDCGVNISAGFQWNFLTFEFGNVTTATPVCLTGTFAGTFAATANSLFYSGTGHPSIVASNTGAAKIAVTSSSFLGVTSSTLDNIIQFGTADTALIVGNVVLNSHGLVAFAGLHDSAVNLIAANNLNGWTFTPPGTLGIYQGQVAGIETVTGTLNIPGRVTIDTGGSVTDNLVMSSLGGAVSFKDGLNTAPIFQFLNSAGVPLLRAASGAGTSANYVEMKSEPTGVGPAVVAAGSDTNVALQIGGKGSGEVQIISHFAVTGGGRPAAANCGGAGTLTLGFDSAFIITTGPAPSTTCTITPGATFSASVVPSLTALSPNIAAGQCYVSSHGTASIVVTCATAVTNGVFSMLAIPTN